MRCEVPMSLSLAVHDAIRKVDATGDATGQVVITFTPDAVPVLADMLPGLWKIKRWWGVKVVFPEEPAVGPPRVVVVRAQSSRHWIDYYLTAEAVRDSVRMPLMFEASPTET